MQKKSKLAGRYDEKPLTKENRAADAEKTEDTGPEIEMDIMASMYVLNQDQWLRSALVVLSTVETWVYPLM